MPGAVKTQLHTSRVAVRCGRIRQDGSRCRFSWFALWVSDDGAVKEVQPRTAEWSPDGRVGAWWEGLLVGEDGFLKEKQRWKVTCSKRCGAAYPITLETLQAKAREAVAEHRSTIWLVDLTTPRD
jgi:hypothetical protein